MEPTLDMPNAVEKLFRRLEPFVSETIWIGKMAALKNIVGCEAEVKQSIANQADNKIDAIYDVLRNGPKGSVEGYAFHGAWRKELEDGSHRRDHDPAGPPRSGQGGRAGGFDCSLRHVAPDRVTARKRPSRRQRQLEACRLLGQTKIAAHIVEFSDLRGIGFDR